jgi:hypothetical protein
MSQKGLIPRKVQTVEFPKMVTTAINNLRESIRFPKQTSYRASKRSSKRLVNTLYGSRCARLFKPNFVWVWRIKYVRLYRAYAGVSGLVHWSPLLAGSEEPPIARLGVHSMHGNPVGKPVYTLYMQLCVHTLSYENIPEIPAPVPAGARVT